MNFQQLINRVFPAAIYGLLLMIFSWGMYGILYHTPKISEEVQNARAQNTPGAKTHESAKFASTNGSMLSPSSLDPTDPQSFDISKSLMICCLAFALVYLGGPIFNYVTFFKPIKKMSDELIAGNISAPVNGSPVIGKVNTQIKTIVDRQNEAIKVIEGICKGDYSIRYENADEDDALGKSLHSMQVKLQQISIVEKQEAWVNQNINMLEKILKEESEWNVMVSKVVMMIAKSVSAGVGVIYEWESSADDEYFQSTASFGYYDNLKTPKKILKGEGQLGQVAIQKTMNVLNDVPKGYLVIHSGLGSASPVQVIITPFIFKDGLYGALELGLFKPLQAFEIQWIKQACESLAAHFFNHSLNAKAKIQLEELTNKQAMELVQVHTLQRQTFEKLEQQLQEVEAEKFKNQAILEGCVDGVVTFDHHGTVTFFNKAAEEIFAIERYEVLGHDINTFLPIEISAQNNKIHPVFISSGVKKSIGIRTEVSAKDQRDEIIDVLITCTEVKVATGSVFTFFIQKISVDLF